jgi:phenylpropionate dioxygenase-like ring-hydroxylating dioxygenase large terminal subunit
MIDEQPVQVSVRPGDARCPGPSTKDIIANDTGGAPAPLLEESYAFIGDEDVAFTNYTSPERARLEHERMWSRVWQWACREEHIPKVGDYYVYDIGDRSLIVIRTEDGIKAYNNFCLHRGTQLRPSGSQGRAKQFRCPFHGWTWNTAGDNTYLPCRWDFPHLSDDDLKLPEAQVGVWGGFVFVNFDPNAAPLEEYLGVLPRHFADWDLADRYVEVHARKRLPANWKAAAEAFLEAYHVLETHSQAIMTTGDANAAYDVFGDNITRFIHTTAWPSPHIENKPDEDGLLDLLFARKAPGVDRPQRGEGETARDVYARFVQEAMGERYGRDFSKLSITETIDSIEYYAFPNAFFFPGLTISMIYRFRPAPDPDHCIFDLVFLRPKPLDRPAPPPAEPFDLDVDDSYTITPGIDQGLAHVYDQDTANMAAQTKGFKGSMKRGQSLGNYQEVRARHLHQMVDRYLATPLG